MCGRFSISTPWEELRERFDVEIDAKQYAPRFNVSPGQDMWVVTEEIPDKAQLFHWGLIPFWARDSKIGYKLINARAETIAEKPAFKTPFQKHRCLILADGFYEWDKKLIKHIPYRIILKDSKPFAFAGICDYWKDEKDNEIGSFSIITTQANELIAKIHDRMPVILSPEKEKKWLDPKLDINEAREYLKSYPAERMNMYEIATLINSPKNDMEEVLRPI